MEEESLINQTVPEKDKISILDYFLVFMLVATSGIMFFYKNEEYIVFGFLVGLVLFLRRKGWFDTSVVVILIAFLAIEILQMVSFNNYSIKTSLGTVLKILFAYFVIKLVGRKFFITYVNILYYTAIISFVFYGLTFIPPVTNFIISNITPLFKPVFSIPEGPYGYAPNIILYTYNRDHVEMMRNSGPFWESGAFSIYLIIAIIFNTLLTGKFWVKKNIVLSLAVITTFSTAGYIGYFFYLISYYVFSRDIKYKMLYLIVFGLIVGMAYFNVSFLSDKVTENISRANTTTQSRFGSALADLKLFSEKPLLGYGRKAENKFGRFVSFYSITHRNNGLTDLLASYGILIFLLYFSYLWRSSKIITEKFTHGNLSPLMLFGTIVLLSFSQTILLYPFFYSLLMLKTLN